MLSVASIVGLIVSLLPREKTNLNKKALNFVQAFWSW